MGDIEVDSDGIHTGRVPPQHSQGKESFSDEQVDSGLGSIGYYSCEEKYLSNEDSFLKSELQLINSKSNSRSSSNYSDNRSSDTSVKSVDSAIVSDFAKLDIASTGDTSRCDSGISVDQEKSSNRSKDLEDNSEVTHSFSAQQVFQIFNGDEDGDNHLHLSIIHVLPEVTMQIINLAPDSEWLSQTNNLLQTPLHLAVITRQVSVVRRLMCAGAAVDVRDRLGNTPLHVACRLGFEDVVSMLLRPIQYEETYQNTYYSHAQQHLAKIPQDLDVRNYEGLTCLHLAAMGGHINVMRQILSAGASVNAGEGKSGRTVLHMAADWGHISMLEYLLTRRELDINARTYAGLTAIVLAYGRQHLDAMNVLYECGASCETMPFTDESDMDNSDDEMIDDQLLKKSLASSGGVGYHLQACR